MDSPGLVFLCNRGVGQPDNRELFGRVGDSDCIPDLLDLDICIVENKIEGGRTTSHHDARAERRLESVTQFAFRRCFLSGHERMFLIVTCRAAIVNRELNREPQSMVKWSNIRNKVVVIAEFAEDGDTLAKVLAKEGIRTSPKEGLVLVLARSVLSPELSAINRWLLECRRPWMLVKPAGKRIWVGPIFTPGTTGCWECLAHRLRENRWTEDVTGSGASAVFELAAKQVKIWNLIGVIQELTPSGELVETHTLTRRPQCIACGGKLKQTFRGFQLRSRNKIVGGARTCSARDTLARLARHESNLTGIVACVRQAPDWQALPTYLAEHCRPLPLGWPDNQLRPAPQPVAGKGASEEDARASCLAEAMERYSIQWQGDEPRQLARRSELAEAAIGFEELALWSEAQLAGRKCRNREQSGCNFIPVLPADDAEIEWTPVWSLTERRRKHVPTSYCYLYYPGMTYLADSNGCAAGNTIEEAIVQAFLELVERDAVGIWWYNRLRRPPITLEGPMKARYAEVRRELARRGRTIAVLDLTTDFEIPVFAAVSAGENGKNVLIGTGAHLNAKVALSRALGELCQVVECLGEGIGRHHGRLTAMERGLRRWFRRETLATQPYLIPRGKGKPLTEFRDWSQPDVKKEVGWCVERAQSLGLELLVLDMTRLDIDFPVVRVIAPGMRHCWGRSAPGRLYDVPVKMGDLARARRESELNPIAYFL